jgi:hypothetical protein
MIIYVIFNIDYILIVIIVYQKIDVNCILFVNFGIKVKRFLFLDFLLIRIIYFILIIHYYYWFLYY